MQATTKTTYWQSVDHIEHALEDIEQDKRLSQAIPSAELSGDLIEVQEVNAKLDNNYITVSLDLGIEIDVKASEPVGTHIERLTGLLERYAGQLRQQLKND